MTEHRLTLLDYGYMFIAFFGFCAWCWWEERRLLKQSHELKQSQLPSSAVRVFTKI